MKRLITLIAALMLVTTGCQKDKVEPNHNIVVYHGNGGLTANGESSVKDVSLKRGYYIRAKENMFTNGDYIFMGWSKSANGAYFCGPGDEVFRHYYYDDYDNCIDLYALWGHYITMCNGSCQLSSNKTCHFYDSGGSNGDYSNNEDYTYTFYAPSGKRVKIVFDNFRTENVFDYLTINGSKYGGSNSPGTQYSSDNALTVKWHSDGSYEYSGWSATVTVVD